MKKAVSLIIAAVCAASVLVSCSSLGERVVEGADPYRSSSSGFADEAWLKTRLGEIPANVTVGTADSLGINMDSFEDDGYIIRNEGGETILCGKTADGLDRAVRKYARYVRYGRGIADESFHEGARIKRLTIAGRDIAEYTVAYTSNGRKPVLTTLGKSVANGEYAAREFVRLTEMATGIALPLLDLADGATLPEHYILFEAVEDGGEYGETGYEYRVDGGNVIFCGSGIAAGCSNGVYFFFEDECGWRNLTFGDSYLTESEHTDVPEGTSARGELTFDSAEYCSLGGPDEAFVTDNPTTTYRGVVPKACHGMQNYRFCDEEGIDYWFEQICYTSEDRYEECVANVEKYIENELAAGQVLGESLTYIDIAQGDNNNFCHCRECMKVLKEEGSDSGAVLRFANRLAEEVDEKYPGLKYLIFGYLDTKYPPKKTVASDLVSVTFCLDGCCFNHAIPSHECTNNTTWYGTPMTNDDFLEWLDGWSAICNNVYIWYYRLDGSYAQFSQLYTIYDELTYFRSRGIKGIMLNGANGGGTCRIEQDMFGWLQWHADATKEEYIAAMERKVEESFGEGSLDAFIAFERLVRASTISKGCNTGWVWQAVEPRIVDYAYFGAHSDAVLDKWEDVIADAPTLRAEKLAKKLSLTLLYEGCAGRYFDAVGRGDAELLAKLNADYALFVERSEEVGYSLENYAISINGSCPVARTMEEESAIWTAYGINAGS